MAFNLLDADQDLVRHPWGSAGHLHACIEAMRLSFADTLKYNADPAVEPVPIAELLDKQNAAQQWSQVFDSTQVGLLPHAGKLPDQAAKGKTSRALLCRCTRSQLWEGREFVRHHVARNPIDQQAGSELSDFQCLIQGPRHWLSGSPTRHGVLLHCSIALPSGARVKKRIFVTACWATCIRQQLKGQLSVVWAIPHSSGHIPTSCTCQEPCSKGQRSYCQVTSWEHMMGLFLDHWLVLPNSNL